MFGVPGVRCAYRHPPGRRRRADIVFGRRLDRRQQRRARGASGFAGRACAPGGRRDPRPLRRQPHGHRRRLGDRPGARRTGRRRDQGRLSRRAAGIRAAPEGRGLPADRAAEADPCADGGLAAERGWRVGLHRRLRSRRGRQLFWRDCGADDPPAALSAPLAMDLDDLPARDVLAAQRADHRADQLSGRRDRHAAGHLPTQGVRRFGLRRQPHRRLGLARACAADDRDHDRRPHGLGDHRRNRLDGHARGDRRPQGDGARSARGADHAAAGRAGDRPAGADLRRGPRGTGRRPRS